MNKILEFIIAVIWMAKILIVLLAINLINKENNAKKLRKKLVVNIKILILSANVKMRKKCLKIVKRHKV